MGRQPVRGREPWRHEPGRTHQPVVARLRQGGQVQVHTTLVALPTLSEERALLVFRMVQELLSNALKHAKASEITLEATTPAEGLVQVRYHDNGVGFDATQHLGRGMGLRSLESRATLLEGTHTVRTQPGQGTEILITFPTQTPTE